MNNGDSGLGLIGILVVALVVLGFLVFGGTPLAVAVGSLVKTVIIIAVIVIAAIAAIIVISLKLYREDEKKKNTGVTDPTAEEDTGNNKADEGTENNPKA